MVVPQSLVLPQYAKFAPLLPNLLRNVRSFPQGTAGRRVPFPFPFSEPTGRPADILDPTALDPFWNETPFPIIGHEFVSGLQRLAPVCGMHHAIEKGNCGL